MEELYITVASTLQDSWMDEQGFAVLLPRAPPSATSLPADFRPVDHGVTMALRNGYLHQKGLLLEVNPN